MNSIQHIGRVLRPLPKEKVKIIDLATGKEVDFMMELIDQYFKTQKEIYDYFGYTEDWVTIPLSDNRHYYWQLTGEGPGDEVLYADTLADLEDGDAGNYYSAEIYTQRFLPKWVYRGEEYTMVSGDTHCDGNRYLMVFSNEYEVK
jgi:hypothetical protein